MKKPFLTLFIALLSLSSSAQQFHINFGVDTLDEDKKQAAHLWMDYLHSNPDSLYDNVYWNFQEKLRYKRFDLLNAGGIVSPSLYAFLKRYDNTVLSIQRLSKDTLLLRSMFYRPTSNAILAITQILAIQTAEGWKLGNYLPYHSRNWKVQTVGKIRYHYPPSYTFRPEQATKAHLFLQEMGRRFDSPYDSIDYYIAEDCDGIYRLRGYDFGFNMGNAGNCGFIDEANDLYFATATSGEFHQHELMHLINKQYPKAHWLWLSGLAAYYGGENAHHGKPLIHHIKRVNEFLQKHPEIDLNKPTAFYQLDAATNPQYVIGALLCEKAFKEGGLPLMKTILVEDSKDSSDEVLQQQIAKKLKIKSGKLDTYLRQRIAELVAANEFVPIN